MSIKQKMVGILFLKMNEDIDRNPEGQKSRELSDPARLIRRLARYGLDDEVDDDEGGAGLGDADADGTGLPDGLPAPMMGEEGGGVSA